MSSPVKKRIKKQSHSVIKIFPHITAKRSLKKFSINLGLCGPKWPAMILKLPWSPGLYLKHQVHFEFCIIITLYYSRKIPWPPTQNLNIIDVPGSLAELIWVSSGMFPCTVGDVSQWRSWGSQQEKHGVNPAVRSGLLFQRIDFPYGSAHSVCEGEHSFFILFYLLQAPKTGNSVLPCGIGG